MLGQGKSYLMGKIVQQNLTAYNRVTSFQRTPQSRRAVLPNSSETLIGTYIHWPGTNSLLGVYN